MPLVKMNSLKQERSVGKSIDLNRFKTVRLDVTKMQIQSLKRGLINFTILQALKYSSEEPNFLM